MTKTLHGVIAAIATAVDEKGEPDCARSTALARFLLDTGCDGLNVLGTTGEANSFSLDQRRRVMSAYAAAGLPLDRMMVGTGAAAVADAVALTKRAAELGFMCSASRTAVPELRRTASASAKWIMKNEAQHKQSNRMV